VSSFRIEAELLVEADIEAAFEWYEIELPGLGLEFLQEVRASYLRIIDGPLKYEELRSGVRRALTKRFPYAIYFVVEGQVIVILAVLHCARDPEEWQWRI
jgi:toxin ParE1/3/4